MCSWQGKTTFCLRMCKYALRLNLMYGTRNEYELIPKTTPIRTPTPYWRIGHQKITLFSKKEHRLRGFGNLKRIVSFKLTEKDVLSNQILVELQLCEVCCFRHHKPLLDDNNLTWPCLLKKLGEPKAFAIINFVTNGLHNRTRRELAQQVVGSVCHKLC